MVIARARKQSIEPQPLAPAGKLDDVGGVVAARPGYYRYAALSRLHHDFNHSELFFVGERRVFAGRSARDQKVDPRADLELNERAQRLGINRAVFSERSY